MFKQTKYVYKPSVEYCKSIFVASCVESAARAEGIPAEEMYCRMHRVGLIEDYILPCYNVLHAESRQNITQDILEALKIREERML